MGSKVEQSKETADFKISVDLRKLQDNFRLCATS